MKKLIMTCILLVMGAQAFGASDKAVERHQETIADSIRVMEVGISRADEAGDVSTKNFLEIRVEELQSELTEEFVTYLKSEDVSEEDLNNYTMEMGKRTSAVKKQFDIK